MSTVQQPFPSFNDLGGDPLDNGYIYIGIANQDPQTSPKQAYWDAAYTIPATQPIRTLGGFIVRNGSPANVYVNGSYSVTVRNRGGALVSTNPITDNAYVTPADLALSTGAAGVGWIQAFTGAVKRWVQDKLRESLSVMDFGAVGDGSTDDTAAFNLAIAAASIGGKKLLIPTPSVEYRITSTLDIDQYLAICGENGGLVSQYFGKQRGGSRIKYTGTGPCFQVNPNPSPGPSVRLAYGVSFEKLTIQGTTAGSHGIKVSDTANINVAGMDLAGFRMKDVFIYDFKAGRAAEIVFCFNNKLDNFVAETCGVAVTLNYAHSTAFVGGSLEQCLVGLDSISTLEVNLHGTIRQGLEPSRIASQGLSMPADFFVWPSGWNGTGFSAITRTVPLDYAGIGIRNYGSIISVFGGYEEGNAISYCTELDSTTNVYGGYVDLDLPVRYWAQFGIGAFNAQGVTFLQGAHGAFVGVFVTARSYAAPFNTSALVFPTTLPTNKYFVGPQGDNVGTAQQFNPSAFRSTTTLVRNDLTLSNSVLSTETTTQTTGFSRFARETYPGGAITGAVSANLATGTVGTNILVVTDNATVTFTLVDAARQLAGVPLRVTVINVNAALDTTITFSNTNFLTGSASYTLAARKQRVFSFFYDNGTFLEEGVEVPL